MRSGFSIPWWVYLIVILIGIGLSILFFVLFATAKRRGRIPPVPGALPPGSGIGFLIGGIVSAVLLVLVPLILMLVLQPWGRSSGSRYVSGDWPAGRYSDTIACEHYVEFDPDGTATIQDDGETKQASWSAQGDTVTLRGNGRTLTMTRDGNALRAGPGASGLLAPCE